MASYKDPYKASEGSIQAQTDDLNSMKEASYSNSEAPASNYEEYATFV